MEVLGSGLKVTRSTKAPGLWTGKTLKRHEYESYCHDYGMIMTEPNVERSIKLCLIKSGWKLFLTALHSLPHISTTFNDSVKEGLKNIVGKGENAVHQHFLLFPQYRYFLSFPLQISILQSPLFCHLQMLSIRAACSKILLFVKGLIYMYVFPGSPGRITLSKLMHVLFIPECFQKASSSESLKLGILW